MSILKVQGHPNLVRDLKTQAIVNVDSDAYARYMARKKKQQAKDDELKDVVREINTIKQIAQNQLEDVAEFFRTYKSLEGRVIVIDGWRVYDAVDELLKSCIKAHLSNLKEK